jgi:alkanesulfonate monooxygenase SsuD/methylene tetrahydromethanopterin reductase-like flavin-dependent oxidoreductase (luciferase family)
MKVGVLILPEHQGPDGVAVWRHVEQLGFHHAWTFDHLAWRSLRDRPWFDAMITLAAAAGATGRISLGTLVTTPNFRHPVTLAKEVMTLDHISNGRFLLGLGAGAEGPDATVLGGPSLSAGEHAARFEEFVALTDQLLRHPVTTHHGHYYSAVEAHMVPGCVQTTRTPFAIAATGARGMRLAATYADTWVTYGPVGDPQQWTDQEIFAAIRDQMDQLEAACDTVGRDYATLRKLVYLSRLFPDVCSSSQRLMDVLGLCEELKCSDAVVAYPRRAGVLAGDPAVLEGLAATWTDHPTVSEAGN